MNVGQIFESMLTLAAVNLSEKYKILPFDEKQSTKEVSKNIVYNKLYEAKKKLIRNGYLTLIIPVKQKY